MNKQQIEDALKDYHWMVKEIVRLKEELGEVKHSGTAQYGIQATLPKAQGGNSDPVGNEVMKNDRRYKSLNKFIDKVNFIEQHAVIIKSDREVTVLNCTLSGMNNVQIAHHMGVSEKSVRVMVGNIAKKMSENAEKAENPECLARVL